MRIEELSRVESEIPFSLDPKRQPVLIQAFFDEFRITPIRRADICDILGQ